jgi:hypothetical protein
LDSSSKGGRSLVNIGERDLAAFFSRAMSASLSIFLLLSPWSLSGETTFERTYGGTLRDYATSIDQTSDGGYIMAGQASSSGPGLNLLKTDSRGRVLWSRLLDSPADQFSGFSVSQVSDGGYVVCASYWCCPRQATILVVRADSLGSELWRREYSSASREYSWGSCIQETEDLGFILTGAVGTTPVLVKLDRAGNTSWENSYSVGSDSPCRCVRQTHDGGYVAVGGRDDMFMMRLDPSGRILWAKNYGGTEKDEGQWVEPTRDGGYILVGYTESRGSGGKDMYLVKTDSLGAILWTKTYGTEHAEMGYSVRQTADGGYILAGVTHSVGGSDDDGYLVRTDSLGNPLWLRSYGGDETDKCFSVRETSDGGYALVGYTGSCGSGDYDIYFVKTDSQGLVESIRDASVLDIAEPGSDLRAGSACHISATLKNPGSSCVEYTVVATIENEYADTVRVRDREPVEVYEISFKDWIVPEGASETYTLTVYTDLEGDSDPANDFAQKTISVR